jgi:hypothetical protein
MKVTLKSVRAAFLHVHKPDEKFHRFGGTFPIEPGSANAKAISAAIEKVAAEKWGAKGKTIVEKLYEDGGVCYSKKPKKNAEGEVYDGFEGMYSIAASQPSPKPTVLGRNKEVLAPDSGKPYSGCYVNAIIDIWAQDNSFGKKINASLSGVQFERDGDAFAGGAPASMDEFEDLGDGADAAAVL